MLKDGVYRCNICMVVRDPDKLFLYSALDGKITITRDLPMDASNGHICINCIETIMDFMHDCLSKLLAAGDKYWATKKEG